MFLPVEGVQCWRFQVHAPASPRAKRNLFLHLIHSTVWLHLIRQRSERVWGRHKPTHRTPVQVRLGRKRVLHWRRAGGEVAQEGTPVLRSVFPRVQLSDLRFYSRTAVAIGALFLQWLLLLP